MSNEFEMHDTISTNGMIDGMIQYPENRPIVENLYNILHDIVGSNLYWTILTDVRLRMELTILYE
jgi:hypothetical protein